MISCSDYDYIEIVCLYHYPVELTMKSGKIVGGIALDTKRNAAKQECIEMEVKQDKLLVVLDEISKLEVSVDKCGLSTLTSNLDISSRTTSY